MNFIIIWVIYCFYLWNILIFIMDGLNVLDRFIIEEREEGYF